MVVRVGKFGATEFQSKGFPDLIFFTLFPQNRRNVNVSNVGIVGVVFFFKVCRFYHKLFCSIMLNT